MNKAKVLISPYGNGIAVGLEGTKEQIEREYNQIERENFMLYQKAPAYIFRELDGGAPSWASETED